MFFSFFKSKPSLSLVFNIRDTSVSVAAVRFEKEKKPEMILCQNFELKLSDSKNHKKYLSSMIQILDKSLVSIRKGLVKIGNKENIDKYYFFIGSPWVVSQAKIIKIIKDKLFEVNNNLLSQIIVGEEAIIEKKIEEDTRQIDWRVLEEKIIQAKLNGYKVDQIYGKKTQNLSIELFVSFIPHEIQDKLSFYIDEKIGKNIRKQSSSCTISAYSFFRDLYPNKNDFIYVDIGKLITDVYVVRDDVIFGVISIPFGEENIINLSLTKTNLTRDIFLSHLNVGLDKKFDLDSHNNGQDLLKYGFDIWTTKLKYAMSKICTEMNIPNSIFIITNSTISNILVRELSDDKKDTRLEILGSKMEVLAMNEGMMNGFVVGAKNFPNEPYIKMDLVYLDKTINN